MFKQIGIIKIMGHDVAVYITDEEDRLTTLDGFVALGLCNVGRSHIILDIDLSISQLQSLLFHELCEFVKINCGANYADEHDYFAAYNNVLWGEVKNNQDWLFGSALKKAITAVKAKGKAK